MQAEPEAKRVGPTVFTEAIRRNPPNEPRDPEHQTRVEANVDWIDAHPDKLDALRGYIGTANARGAIESKTLDELQFACNAFEHELRADGRARLRVVRDGDDDAGSWAPLDLAPYLNGEIRRTEAELCRRDDGQELFYRGKLHTIAAEPGVGKTWLAMFAVAQALGDDGIVLWLDFEDTPETVIERLRALGVADDVIADRFRYVRPHGKFGPIEQAATACAAEGADLVVVDAATEAIASLGLDSNSNDDVARFYDAFIEPLRSGGGAVLVIDHVVKDKAARGQWAAGAGFKKARIDGAAFMLVSISGFARGREGRAKLVVAKDRHGALRTAVGGTVAEFVLASDPETDEIVARLEVPTDRSDDGSWRPTTLMQRVSRHLEGEMLPVTKNSVVNAVNGTAAHVRAAIDALVHEGFVRAEPGPNRSQLLTSVRAFDAARHEVPHEPF